MFLRSPSSGLWLPAHGNCTPKVDICQPSAISLLDRSLIVPAKGLSPGRSIGPTSSWACQGMLTFGTLYLPL